MTAVATFFGLLEQAGLAHKKLLDEAFERGREVGRSEAMAEFKARLAGLTDTLIRSDAEAPESEQPTDKGVGAEREAEVQDTKRASPGSVKPTIAKLVSERPGITTRDVERLTGFKLNTIRGTIWTLQKEGVIERREEGIYPLAPKHEADAGANNGDAEAQTNEAAGEMSVPDAPTASVEGAEDGLFS